MSKRTSHAFEEHTSEVRLVLRAATWAELFEEAGRALAELFVGGVAICLRRASRPTSRCERPIPAPCWSTG